MNVFYFLLVVLAIQFSSLNVFGQEAADFFGQNCAMCHTIGGGPSAGPDLKGVTRTKDRAWIEKFIQNPTAVLASGDPFALQLQKEAGGMEMPSFQEMTPALAKSLVDFIEKESAENGAATNAPAPPSETPFTAGDIATGAEIFRGERKLSGGGPACISCHTLGALGGFGGGRLGPDLSQAYSRMGGRKGTGAWLSGPPTPAMKALFREHPLQPAEIVALQALLENASQQGQSTVAAPQADFFLSGVVGMCCGFALIGWIWRRRFRSVRRALLASTRGAQ